ncbi:glycosyltransferase family 4 protein [[Clostridium] innocuum]|nr:glycosyltransferase family 4 protein [[Clostridium] innocuum]
MSKNEFKHLDNQKLNIAMLGHKRIPSREGGIEIVVEELASRMVDLGHNVTCYNRKGHHVSGKKFDTQRLDFYKGIKLKTVFTLNIKGLAAMTASFAGAIGAAFGKYDVVHFHAEGPCAMLWLPKLFGKRCVATVHGLDHKRAKWGKLARFYIMLGEKCAVKYADEIIVLSENVQNYFFKTYGRTTNFIPNGVNKPEIREADIIKKLYNLDKDSYILFLGRLVPEKGLRYLIEAFKMIKTDKKLVIAGGSSDTEEFENEIKNMANNDDRILFTGFVQGKVLDELYSNAYIYALPSDLEGMPLSLLEAMSYGNCCLVSDIDECKAVIENKALSFKKSDIFDLKNNLQNLCENVESVFLYKSKSSEYVCNKYSWSSVVLETLKLYRR